MIFLIVYDRANARLVKFERYKSTERLKAQQKRFQIELGLNQRKDKKEVVLLEAASENRLRQTHARYFRTIPELTNIARHA